MKGLREKSIFYYLVLLIIFFAPMNCYRIPITSLITVSLSKILLAIAWGMIILKLMINYTFQVEIAKKLYRIRLLCFGFFFFLIVNIIMLFKSDFPGFGIKMVGLIITVWFLAILLYIILDTQIRIFSALKMLVMSSIPTALFSIWQLYSFYMFGYMPDIPFLNFFPLPYEESLLHRSYMWYMPSIPRTMGFLAEPNTYGLFLAICLFTAFVMLFQYNDNFKLTLKWKIIFLLSIFINIPIFIFTFSRSGWLTFIFGIGLFFMQSRSVRYRLLSFKYIKIGIIFLFLVYFAVHFIGEDVLIRRLSFQEITPHITARASALPYIESNILLGIGYGNFGLCEGERFGVSSTHSYYLNYLVEGGVIGFLSFIIFCLSLLGSVFNRKIFFRAMNYLPRIFILMILFNNIFYHTFLFEFVWVVIGISLGLTFLKNQDVSKG